jgi:hypothetical protein
MFETTLYIGQPDIPVGVTFAEYRRMRPRRVAVIAAPPDVL